MTSKYRCDKNCSFFDDSDEENKTFDLIYCKDLQMDIEPVFREQSKRAGCASHSGCVEDFVSLAGKMEDVSRKDEREKVLEEAINAIEERIKGIFNAYRDEKNEKLTELPFASANGMGECILILKNLRRGDMR